MNPFVSVQQNWSLFICFICCQLPGEANS